MSSLKDSSPYSLMRGPVDLTSCDLEPVHRIGAVQPHGALLVFDHLSGRLLQASTNWRDFLPDGPPVLEGLFPPSMVPLLRTVDSSDRAVLLGETLPGEIEVSALRAEEGLVVELESAATALPFDPITGMSTLIQALQGTRSADSYLALLASELRRTLSIDHVMIYRFLPDWAGEVVAEASVDDTRYLGLRFPATDIPQPAREVFRQVWVRHIADVKAPSVPVNGEGAQLTSLNLTQIGIRAASPIHLEYLANMNVGASLTLSLRLGDNLWGLIAGHHRSPYLLRPSARASLELVAQMASWQLSAHLQEGTRGARRQAEERLAELEARLEVHDELHLSPHLEPLKGLVDCDLVAVYEDRSWTRRAGVGLAELESLYAWVRQEASEAMLFHRNELPADLFPGYAGCLVLAVPEAQGRVVFWLRREQSHSVRWAGNPEKSERWSNGRLNPRASFAEYVELTQGKSLPWTELDLWKAGRLAEMLRSVSLRQHRRLVQRNIALAQSNRELDSFAYMASHDLKEPLRGIHNYATFLKEDYAHLLDGEGLTFLDGLTSLSSRMTVLLDALLAYSRLNSQEIETRDCDLKALATETVQLLKTTRQAEIKLLEPLPVVQAYPPFLAEILVNLLTNAIKYSDASNRLVEIGALAQEEGYDTFFVRDNGIGIAAEFHQEIFRLFRRLHGEGERGDGSGVGLTIVEKMVQRHGGKVWVQSEPGHGSTFYVSLPRLAAASSAPSDGSVADGSNPAIPA